jgi:3-deoxy-7-phosphoheptulonate synthase
MVVVMQERATEEQIQKVVAQLVDMGFDVHRSTGAARTVLGAVGIGGNRDPALLEVLDGVQEVVRITEPYKLASRTFKPDDTIITVGDVRIGGDEVVVIAGPCSAESEEQVMTTSAAVKRAGAKMLRGGAFKPRSSPYSFQGLGEEGLKLLRRAADAHDLKLVSEVMDLSQIGLMDRYVDVYRSARATCRTSRCCANSAMCANPCCSNAASRRPSKSGCSRPSTSSPAGTWP